MSTHRPALALALGAAALTLLGCSSVSLDTRTVTAPPANTGAQVRVVRSFDDRFYGEISGDPAPESRFGRVKIGMDLEQVHKLIGEPDQIYSHTTGKVWIPFYFGADGRRIVTLHRGEGCLTYSAGGLFNSRKQLLRMDVDAAGGCFKP
jgi:hypothetical protein